MHTYITLRHVVMCHLLFLNIVYVFDGNRSQLDDIACINAFNGCCCCDQSTDQCPEWNADEIVTFMVINLKIFGMVAFISMIYYFGAVSVTDITRKSLKYYRSEFI